MNIRGVDFVLYNISDYHRALEFYRDVLGLNLIEEYGGYWLEFQVGNVTLALCAPSEDVPEQDYNQVGKGASVAFAIEDVTKAVEELRKKGVLIISEPKDTGVCILATIADLDGNKIVLHQRKDGTSG